MWVDLGVWHDVRFKNGTVERRPVRGLLRVPRPLAGACDELVDQKTALESLTPEWKTIAKMLRKARANPDKAKITCWVKSAQPASSRLVLHAKKISPRRVPLVPGVNVADYSTLQVGRELRGATVVMVGKTLCRLRVPVALETTSLTKRQKRINAPPKIKVRRVGAFLRDRDLPENVVLSSRPVKPEKARILRRGDSIDVVYAKRVHSASLGLDVAMEPVDLQEIEDEEARKREDRLERGRRRQRTNELKVGQIVQGRVTKLKEFGAVVDFNASATGVVRRSRVATMKRLAQWKREDTIEDYEVTDIVRDNRPVSAPRVTLKRKGDPDLKDLFDDEDDDLMDAREEDDDDGDYDDDDWDDDDDDDEDPYADADDDLEAALGLDTY